MRVRIGERGGETSKFIVNLGAGLKPFNYFILKGISFSIILHYNEDDFKWLIFLN